MHAAGPDTEVAADSGAARTPETLQARFRYGAVLRGGGQTDLGPGLSYRGITPNDLALGATYLPLSLSSLSVGAALELQREGFALFDGSSRVTQGTLSRGHLGAAARYLVGPLRLEARVAYGLAQLPIFESTLTPALAAVQRHAVLVGARVSGELGPVTVEGRGEYPIPLAASYAGASASTSGFGAGAAVGMRLGYAGPISYGALVDFQYASDTASLENGTRSTQQLMRLGAALEVRWPDAPPRVVPTLGGLLLSVVDAASGEPVSGAKAVLFVAGVEREVPMSGSKADVAPLSPGPVVARVSASGYLPQEASAQVVAGPATPLAVKLIKEPPKLGSLAVHVLDAETGAPIEGASINVRDNDYASDASGAVSLVDLAPGPFQVKVAREGYQPVVEAVSVVVGKRSDLTVKLVLEAKKIPATLSGLVRSTRGGKPVAATLAIPQAKLKFKANAQGAFSVQVESGVYTVNISSPGYLPQTKSVVVKPGDQTIFNVDLHPK